MRPKTSVITVLKTTRIGNQILARPIRERVKVN
jgi:hypothetical protein